MTVRLFLLCVLSLTLCSCATLRKPQVVFVPPKVDCGAFEPPKVDTPREPRPGEKDVALWQFNAIGWAAFAEAVLGQRVETAQCMAALREAGVIK